MYKKGLMILTIIIFISLSFPILAAENQNIELQNTNTPYSLAADGGISYDNKHGILVASNNARFESGDIIIVADEIEVFYSENIVRAVGDKLTMQIAEQSYKGSSLELNYNTMKGTISGVSSKVNDLSVSGQSISLDKGNEYEIDKVELTPCILPDPHYSILAKKVTVYPGDKIVAKGVWFYFYGHRVFYLPAYTVKFNKDTGDFERVSVVPNIGYNSTDGIYLDIDYPYELGDRFEGYMSGQLNQYGDKYFKMENSYRLNSKLELINSYLYQDEVDDDGEIIEKDELSAGLHYSNDRLDLYSLYKRDYLVDKNILELDSRYKYQGFNFRYFNKFTEGDLSNEIYSIRYNSRYPLQLLYKKGYDIDYLPYLSVSNLKYSFSGFNINSSIGSGKVANKGISSDKVRLDLRMDRKFIINEKMGLNLYGQLENHYYIDNEKNSPSENYYNYYKLGFNTNINSPINEKIDVGYRLGYSYTWETGEAYLPEDKNDIKEILNPAVGISYHISEYDTIRFDVEGSYEFNTEDLEDLNVRFTRQYDCYSYYIAYDVVDEAYEFGISF